MAKETKAKPAEEKKTTRRRTKKADAVVEEAQAVVEEAKAEEAKAEEVKAEAEEVKPEEVKPEAVEAKAETKEAKAEDLPDVAENDGIHRYDITITSERAGYKPPRAGVVSMVQQLAYRGFASPVDEAVAETWTEIYFEPGPAAHEIFLEKNYSEDAPVFHELRLKFCDKPFFCDYSETPKRPLYFAIEILGSRFKTPIGAFRKLFLDALNLRITSSAHDAEPIPARKIVPEDEKPFEKKKHERGAGIAGTEVTEV